MKYKIHYSKLNDQICEIPCYEFESEKNVQIFITNLAYPTKVDADKVYVVVVQDDVIITENGAFVIELFEHKLNSVYPYYEGAFIAIYECESYEEGYKLALNIKEPNPLCYDKTI